MCVQGTNTSHLNQKRIILDRFRFLTSPGGYFQARGFFFGSNGLYWSPEHTREWRRLYFDITHLSEHPIFNPICPLPLISIEGAVRRPVTYDNHPIHPIPSDINLGYFKYSFLCQKSSSMLLLTFFPCLALAQYAEWLNYVHICTMYRFNKNKMRNMSPQHQNMSPHHQTTAVYISRSRSRWHAWADPCWSVCSSHSQSPPCGSSGNLRTVIMLENITIYIIYNTTDPRVESFCQSQCMKNFNKLTFKL